MTTISLRMDDQMKKELDEMCEAMGMNISTFYMIYTKKALRDRRIPFDIEAPADPFYSEQNMAQLRKSAQQVKEGKIMGIPPAHYRKRREKAAETCSGLSGTMENSLGKNEIRQQQVI